MSESAVEDPRKEKEDQVGHLFLVSLRVQAGQHAAAPVSWEETIQPSSVSGCFLLEKVYDELQARMAMIYCFNSQSVLAVNLATMLYTHNPS